MTQPYVASLAALGLACLVGCAGPTRLPAQTTQSRPIQALPRTIYADAITVAQFRAVCDALARDLVVQPFVTRTAHPPVVTIRRLENKADIDLDEAIFQETIRVKLMEHSGGAVLFRDDESYKDIVQERLRASSNRVTVTITDDTLENRSTDRTRELGYESGRLSGSAARNERAALREDEREVRTSQAGQVSGQVAEVDYFLRGLIYQVREHDAADRGRGMSYFQYQFRVVDARSGIIVWEKMLDSKLAGAYTPQQPLQRGPAPGAGAPPNIFQQNPPGGQAPDPSQAPQSP